MGHPVHKRRNIKPFFQAKTGAKFILLNAPLQTLQSHPLDGDGMGGPECESAASASIHNIDEDDLLQGPIV